jgi:hypothetical protein
MVLMSACANSENNNGLINEENSYDTLELLKGTWTITKELHSKGKNVVWQGRPTVPQLTFNQNAYFLIVDRVTDEKMQKDGIPAIQERYKGQFTWKNATLQLDHYVEDSLITEKFQINKITDKDLIIEDRSKGRTWFLKR